MPKSRQRRYIGVTRTPQGYAVNLRVRGKLMHCGTFSDIRDAAHVYNLAAREFHGPAARLNKIY